MAGILVLLALAVFVGLAVANERIGRRMIADAMKPTPKPTAHPTRHVGAFAGHPGAQSATVTAYRSYAASSPTVRRYGRLLSDVGAATAPAPGPVAIEIETRQPHRTPDVTADVTVPLTQAIATAVIVALLVGILAYLGGRADALKLAAGAFVITLAGAWLWRLGVVTSLLQVVEVITRHDLDGDGHTGKPPDDEGHTLLVNPDQARQKAAKAERNRERAARLADYLTFWRSCQTTGTAERAHNIRPGTPQQAAFRAKRDLLMRLGLARWKDDGNHNLGWLLTTDEAEAVEILRQHVQSMG